MMDKVEEFIEKYCKKHNITKEEAERHAIVIEYKKYCEER